MWRFLFLFFLTTVLEAASPRFFVVIPSYNNELWCDVNLRSIAQQKYKNFRAIYINDASTDNTKALVSKFIQEHHLEKKIQLVDNPERRGALANLYYTIQKADPDEIVIIIDGDDRLIDDSVFGYVAELYSKNPSIWLTYGNYISEPTDRPSICRLFPEKIIRKRTFRSYPFLSSHLRTFYAGLFQQIKKSDLVEYGKFLPSAYDVAIMMPMLEMASKGHFFFVQKPLYMHNNANPLNDYKRRKIQRHCSQFIRKKPPYAPLNALPFKRKT